MEGVAIPAALKEGDYSKCSPFGGAGKVGAILGFSPPQNSPGFYYSQTGLVINN